ncbi:MAG: hypothetical protein TYPL_1430 [Candidatus Tyloplasma litorale]|nr:MAG: hypothetical protein TYPL_1430 [Mycoplasmatales bacterium]
MPNSSRVSTKVKELNNNFFNYLRSNSIDKFWFRMLWEFISSFSLIFSINFVLSLGEMKIPNKLPISTAIFNVNFLTAIWISTFSFLAFLWTDKTTLSANFVNLVITYKRKKINKKEFSSSILFQFLGGLLAAFIIFILSQIIIYGDKDPLVMGGTIPRIKGLFLNDPSVYDNIQFTFYDPVDAREWDHRSLTYLFVALQGTINGIFILFSFSLNNRIVDKYDNGAKAKLFRYIILVVGISITTILYANTTNWIRLICPAIFGEIFGIINNQQGTEILLTTSFYIMFQLPWLLLVYSSSVLVWRRNKKIKKLKEKGV